MVCVGIGERLTPWIVIQGTVVLLLVAVVEVLLVDCVLVLVTEVELLVALVELVEMEVLDVTFGLMKFTGPGFGVLFLDGLIESS